MPATDVTERRFEVSDVSGQKVMTVSHVPEDATVREVVQEAIVKMRLPANDTEGRPFSYHMRLDREGRHLPGSEKVADALQAGDLWCCSRTSMPGARHGRRHALRNGAAALDRRADRPGGCRSRLGSGDRVDAARGSADARRLGAGSRGRAGHRAALATLGEPYMQGFRVHLGRSDACVWSADFPLTYFRAQARTASARLVEQGVLKDGDSFLYRLTAFPHGDAHKASSAPAFTTEDTPPPLALLDTPIDTWLARSVAQHETAGDEFVVFVPQAVIDEATTLTLAAGDAETGGFLIGHLHRVRDAEPAGAAHEISVEVTALVPARHTVGNSVKLTFTPDTWTDARAAIALRARGEQLLGWFHSHPQAAWCRANGCSEQAQRSCSQGAGFLSEDDGLLHRTMFPRAFTLACS